MDHGLADLLRSRANQTNTLELEPPNRMRVHSPLGELKLARVPNATTGGAEPAVALCAVCLSLAATPDESDGHVQRRG